ncbi:MAG: hypothetical protein DCC75_01465 [Proteobacteria bacterium]|nr:MAG: hypothetical protein DCC75_01465 [Pseudomonadota bacterium]
MRRLLSKFSFSATILVAFIFLALALLEIFFDLGQTHDLVIVIALAATMCILLPALFSYSLRSAIKQTTSSIFEGSAQLQRQNQALFKLTTSKSLYGGSLQQAVQEMTEIAALTLAVERVAVWVLNEEKSELSCVNLFERSLNRHTSGGLLDLKGCPSYFEALRGNRVLVVHDTKKDPLTHQLAHLVRSDVTSLMDAPIYLQGRLYGVVCLSHVGSRRSWQLDEQKFAGSMADIVAIAAEAAQRRKVEDELLESKRFLRRVIDTDPNFVFVKDAAGKFRLVNQAVADAYGTTVEDLVGRTDSDFNPQGDEVSHFRKDDLWVINKRCELFIPEERITDCKGNQRWLQTVKRPLEVPSSGEVHVLGVATDITAQKRLQDELVQSQKMEAIGQLAGGIAHDFNNLLTGIIGYTTLIKMQSERQPQINQNAELIERAACRATELTQKLLGFARKGKHQNVPIDVHSAIKETVAILARTIEKNVSLKLELEAENPFIEGDPGQIQQIILNLALNARDAIAEKFERGTITISTKLVPSEINPSEGAIQINVKDTGCGIDPALHDRIFEPFFTTKAEGKGTGMGLAMVYGIVRNHAGKIRVQSKPGQGAVFEVCFPSIQPRLDKQVEKKSQSPTPGCGRILVVEDHQIVRHVTADMLTSLGYEVTTAKDGIEAIEYFRENHDTIDLVILDLVMPRMGAQACFKEIRRIKPSVRAVLATGYVNNNSVQQIMDDGIQHFMQKPYGLAHLSQIVCKALGKETPSQTH